MTSQAIDFDVEKLSDYLRSKMPDFGAIEQVEKFKAGQSNPTYLLSSANQKRVLRKKPAGKLLKSAHAVEREFRVQKALMDTNVPVPRMHHLCEDNDIIGTPFYIMAHVVGVNHNDPRLPDMPVEQRQKIMSEIAQILSAIHNVDLDATSLSDYGPPGNYFERQITRWAKQYQSSETDNISQMNDLISYLQNHCPDDDGQRTLVHGDFRLDNMMFEKNGHRCLAVLDWELSTLGHPYADLAGVIMQWQMPTGSIGRGLGGVNRQDYGLLEDSQFVDLYCEYRGISAIQNFEFYVAFCFFRMGAILQGVKKRALDGNASNPEKGLQMGAHIPLLAQNGLRFLEQKK